VSVLSRIKQLFGAEDPVQDGSSVEAQAVPTQSQEPDVTATVQTTTPQERRSHSTAPNLDALEELLIDAGVDVETTMGIRAGSWKEWVASGVRQQNRSSLASEQAQLCARPGFNIARGRFAGSFSGYRCQWGRQDLVGGQAGKYAETSEL